jgi:hypothetical protein
MIKINLETNKKPIIITVNPEKTSYKMFKEYAMYKNKNINEKSIFTTNSQEQINNEYEWQKLLQKHEKKETLNLKIKEPNMILEKFGTSFYMGKKILEKTIDEKMYNKQLSRLAELGCLDYERTNYLLVKYNGNLEKVLEMYNKNQKKIIKKNVKNDTFWIKEEKQNSSKIDLDLNLSEEKKVQNVLKSKEKSLNPSFFLKAYEETPNKLLTENSLFDIDKKDSYKESLQYLNDLGYSNEGICLYFLVLRNGDLSEVLKDLKKIQEPRRKKLSFSLTQGTL